MKEYQIALPCWGKCSFDEIRRFFGETCGKFDDCSFLHFNSHHTKRLGDQGQIDGVYDKIFCKIADNDFSLPLLPPYRYVKDATVTKYVEFLQNNYPQWIS